MITYDKVKYEAYEKQDGSFGTRAYFKGKCLSTDTKPTTDVKNGSSLLEMDTATKYLFDQEGSQWLSQNTTTDTTTEEEPVD